MNLTSLNNIWNITSTKKRVNITSRNITSHITASRKRRQVLLNASVSSAFSFPPSNLRIQTWVKHDLLTQWNPGLVLVRSVCLLQSRSVNQSPRANLQKMRAALGDASLQMCPVLGDAQGSASHCSDASSDNWPGTCTHSSHISQKHDRFVSKRNKYTFRT